MLTLLGVGQGQLGGFPRECFGLDYNAITSDFTFTRNSFATRVNEFGLIETVTNLGSDLVQNGSFDELGSELVVNGDFENGTTNWQNPTYGGNNSATLSIDNGSLKVEKNADLDWRSSFVNQTPLTFTDGKTYKITYSLKDGNTSGADVYIRTNFDRSASTVSIKALTNDWVEYTDYYVADSSAEDISFGVLAWQNAGNGQHYFIDNVSVKQVDPNDDWTTQGGVVVEQGKAYSTNGSSSTSVDRLIQTILTSGKEYVVTTTIENYVSGSLRVFLNGVELSNISSNGTFVRQGVASGSAFQYIWNGFEGDITNVSVQEVLTDDVPRIDYTGGTFDIPVLGDELITNGDFENGDTDWILNPSSGTAIVSNGKLNFTNSNSSGTQVRQRNIPYIVGKTYKITYTVTDYIQGNVRLSVGNQLTTSVSANGTFTEYKTYTSGLNSTYIYTNGTTLSIDNISIKEVTAYTTTDKGAFLLEPISTNEITYSEDFSDSYWTKLGTPTITDNYGTSPDGTQNSTRVQGNSLTVIYVSNGAANTNFSRSIYIKATSGSGTIQTLSHNSNTNNVFSIDENWRRVEINSLTSSTGDVVVYAIDMRGASTDIFDVEIWGCQEERGIDYATSYIPTSGTTVTRAQESCVNATPTINSEEGVLYAEISTFDDGNNYEIIEINDGTGNNRITVYFYGSTLYGYIKENNVTKFQQFSTVADVTDFHKVALKWKQDDVALWIDGVEIATLGSFDTFSEGLMNDLSFVGAGTQYFYGNTKDLRVYCKALTDDELIELTTLPPYVGTEFVISVRTDNSGSSADNQFTLPWIGTYDVDWGDGIKEIGVTNTQTHSYGSVGTYDVAVTATTGKIFFSGADDALKLLDIKNWGTCEWTGMGSAFRGCTSLTSVTATDAPNLSNITDISNMFWKCRLSNADFSNWDVSNITNTSLIFSSSGANGTINLSNWDVSNVTNMYAMFYDCTTLQITGIENWNTNSLVNIQQMFKSTSLLDVSFANWNINSITNLSGFLSGNVSTQPVLSTANYDATLISWAAQTPQSNRNVTFGGSEYSYEAAAARNILINTYGWTITDGGQAASPEFALKWETTTPNEEIQIGIGSGTFDYVIDWGDGTVETYNTDANISHTYANAGDHITKISGDFPHINMGDAGISATFKNKLYEILNWGDIAWDSLEDAFLSCSNLDFYSSIDSPNLQNCTSLFKTFQLCTTLGNLNGGNVDLSNWNVSNVTSIGEFIISYNRNLNVDLSGWVINANVAFGRLVSRCLELNVTNWDVSNVTNFSNMLNESNNLKEIAGLDTWNVSNGVNFTRMFRRVYDLTSLGDLTSWQFAPNANLNAMFFANVVDDNLDQTSRNSILNLDVSNAVNMNSMFAYTNTSWLNLSNWDVSGVSDFVSFLHNSTLTTQNYDATLISWAAQSLQSNANISFGNSQYTLGGAAEAARNTLINTYNWTIIDGGGIFVGLLDTYPNASAAYSLRDLASASVGSAVVRVRRSSDNTEQDFTSAEITDGTLATFCSGTDGFVAIWYDQSGNSNNAGQATAINQPKLVSSGVVELDNGKPCIIWDNTNDTMQINTSYSGNNLLSIFSVYNKTSPNPSDDSAYLVFADASLNVPDGVLAWRWGGQIGCYRSGVHSVNGSIPYDTQVNSNFLYTSTQVDFYNNSSLIGSKTTSNAIANFDYTFIQIGRTGGNSSFKNQELIIYQSDQSSNRTGIETNINTEYTIY